MADGTLANIRRVSPCMWLAWEKIQIQSTVSTECLLLSHHCKMKNGTLGTTCDAFARNVIVS